VFLFLARHRTIVLLARSVAQALSITLSHSHTLPLNPLTEQQYVRTTEMVRVQVETLGFTLELTVFFNSNTVRHRIPQIQTNQTSFVSKTYKSLCPLGVGEDLLGLVVWIRCADGGLLYR